MEYTNESGQTITDEQLDTMLDEIERGDFSNFEDASEPIYGIIEPQKNREKHCLCLTMKFENMDG